MPTDPADKNDVGKFLIYLESTLDDEISPHMRVYEMEDTKNRQMHSLIIYANLLTMHY